MAKTCYAKKKNIARKNRHTRVRKKISGTEEIPRLNIYRSNKNIIAQIINDENGKVYFGVSSISKIYKEKVKKPLKKTEQAQKVGEMIAKSALEQGIKKVKFDNGGFKYHGRVKALANAAREAGLII